MSFLFGEKLVDEIHYICAGDDVRCAVAYWGNGIDLPLGSSARVVLNLLDGGTNPAAVRALLDKKCPTKQCKTLHAKVYLSSRGAVVASANASVNALGLKGKQPPHLIEAGIRLADTADVAKWFERLWEDQSDEIDDTSLELADILWAARFRSSRPDRGSIADEAYWVERALSTCAALGEPKYLAWLHEKRTALGRRNELKNAKKYFVRYGRRQFSTKPILAGARLLANPDQPLTRFTGGTGPGGAARRLAELGFEIVDKDGKRVTIDVSQVDVAFGDYPLATGPLPLLYAVGDHETHWTENSRGREGTDLTSKQYSEMIATSLELSPADIKAALSHEWFLVFKVGRGDKALNSLMSWHYNWKIIPDAFFYNDQQEVLLCSVLDGINPPKPPFDVSGSSFSSSFRNLLNEKKYRKLRRDDDGYPVAAFYSDPERVKLHKSFWKELKQRMK